MRYNPKRSRTFSGNPKRRPRTYRCPRCKKVRKRWMDANWWWHHRVSSTASRCWICYYREIDPTWRPGMPRPVVPPGSEGAIVPPEV